MPKTADSDKLELERKNKASDLLESQRAEAADLHASEIRTAYALRQQNRKSAADLLRNDQKINESPEEARRYAAATLASTQEKAAGKLGDSQDKAAKALKDSQLEAASELEAAEIFRKK
jgi:hypothetical protein